MYKPKLFIQQQLKSTLIRGFQKTQYLLSYLKNTWILLANDKNTFFLQQVARDLNTSPEILALLANNLANNDDHWVVRENVATNPNTPPETLDRLVNDDVGVRIGAAQNPNTSPETLERLANDEDWCVRCEVAANPNAPQYIKDYLKIRHFLNCHNNKLIQPIYRLQ
jgi:hypothetical protein